MKLKSETPLSAIESCIMSNPSLHDKNIKKGKGNRGRTKRRGGALDRENLVKD